MRVFPISNQQLAAPPLVPLGVRDDGDVARRTITALDGRCIRAAHPSDAEAIARVHVAAWDRAYRGLISDDIINARTVKVRTEQWATRLREGGRIAYVAANAGGNVEGFATAVRLDGSDGGFESYLQTLYVSPAVWRRGIGGRLLAAIAGRLRCAGATNMALRTMRLSWARVFYERLGARLVPEGLEYDADRFDSVVYAFDDLVSVIANGRGQERYSEAEEEAN